MRVSYVQADGLDLEPVMTDVLGKSGVLSRPWLSNVAMLLCASVPSFMINLDSNIVAASLRSISHSLGVDFTAIEWVISAYTLTFASLVLPAGSLADRYGRKRMLIAGLAIFSVGSFSCGAAPNILVLDVARAAQGVGAALQLSSGLAILSHSFQGAARRRAFAFWGSMVGLAIAIGPVAGGLITQHLGWERAFYLNPIIGAATILLTLTSVVESKDSDATRTDLPGFITFSTFLFLITLALIGGNHEGWNSTEVRSEFTAAAGFFVIFLFVELRQERPMLDLSFFRNPTFVGANLAGLSFAACLLTMLTYLPIYFQGGLGYSAGVAGLLMMPLAIPMIVVPRITVSYRLGGRTLLTGGLAILGAGLFLMALAAPHFRYIEMVAGMILAGIGGGVLNSEVAEVGITAIPPARAGMASGMSGTIRFSGIVIGFAALGALLVSRISSIVAGDSASERVGDAAEFVRNVAAGNLAGTSNVLPGLEGLRELSFRSFGGGYQTILFVASAIALTTSVLCGILITPADTAVARAAHKSE
jgi:EmrB/QacA subfamily drug resistance transporter